MDLRQLQTLMAIAECGSASKASQILNVVQPAISRQMRLLEEELATTLFRRERHGMELTEAGHMLVERARRVMRELEEARAEIQPASGVVSGIVNVGMPSSTCDLLAGDLVATISRRHPLIRMRMRSGYGGPLQQAIQDGELQVAIVNDPKPTPLVDAHFMLNEQLFVVGPPRCGFQIDAPQPLAVLEGRPMVLPIAPHAMRSMVEQACVLENVELQVVAEVSAMDVQKSLVLHGVGWTVLPSGGASNDVQKGVMAAAPLGGASLQRHLALCTPTTRRISPAARAVKSVLEELIESSVSEGRWPGAMLVK